MNWHRRVAAWVLCIGTVLAGLAWPLSAAAQQHNDTVVVSPEETKGLIDSIVAHKDTTSTDTTSRDTETGSSVDSGSLEHNNVRADSVVFRSIPDSVTAAWKSDRDFAYANDPAYWKKEGPDGRRQSSFVRFLDSMLGSRGFKYFIFSLLAAILLYAIIRIIAENNLRLFYRSSGKIAAGSGEDASPLKEDLDLRLQQALAEQDHRTAIRILYLKALRMLNERELIRYHLQATNREYVRQLSGSEFGDPFRFLTGVYEKVWYGEFAVSEGQFEKLYPYFQDFYKSIGQS